MLGLHSYPWHLYTSKTCSSENLSIFTTYIFRLPRYCMVFSLGKVACVIIGKAQLQIACNYSQTSKQNKTTFSELRSSWKPFNGDAKDELLQLYNLPVKLLLFRRTSPQKLRVEQMIGKLSFEIGIYSSDWFPPIIPWQGLNIFKVENLSIFSLNLNFPNLLVSWNVTHPLKGTSQEITNILKVCL